jgi:quercetin dioxygenase-like cupin family protein
MPDDERVWVPQANDVWFRPLLLNTVSGGWCNLLRVRRSGVLSRHRHPMIVVGYVIRGKWRYLEHDWIADEGSFVYEPSGEIHTLVVPDDCAEMITFFNIAGAMITLTTTADPDTRTRSPRSPNCRAHYAPTWVCRLRRPFRARRLARRSTSTNRRMALQLAASRSAHPGARGCAGDSRSEISPGLGPLERSPPTRRLPRGRVVAAS